MRSGLDSVRTKVTRAVRWGWLIVAAALLIVLTALGPDALAVIIGIVLLSFPASLLAGPVTVLIFDFPVHVEGVPFPEAWWIHSLVALTLGYLQWFILLPKLAKVLGVPPEAETR